jgi:CO dehydrogenase maturation factor
MHEERENLPPDVNKQSILESKIYEIIEELPGYDLLVMGRPEGAGCYCYVNNLLRGIMNKLVGNYDVLIIDAEAGLEHFSRKIFRQINDLIVVTDGSRRGLGTAERIRELVEELETDVDHIYVIANKVTDSTRETISSTAAELGLELIGMVPLDEMIVQRDLAGQSLMELPEDSPAVKEIENISRKLNL